MFRLWGRKLRSAWRRVVYWAALASSECGFVGCHDVLMMAMRRAEATNASSCQESPQRRRRPIAELQTQLHTPRLRAIDRRNMALPLRCARAGAAPRPRIPSMRAAAFSTSFVRREQAINSDVRITRYAIDVECSHWRANICKGPESPFSQSAVVDPRSEVCNSLDYFNMMHHSLTTNRIHRDRLRCNWIPWTLHREPAGYVVILARVLWGY